MNIAIIGAGNMGTAIAADLARQNSVAIHSSKPQLFTKTLRYVDTATGNAFESKVARVSDNYAEVLAGAEIIFITLPTPVIQSVVKEITPFINSNTIVGYVPGAGGVEFLSTDMIAKGACVFGFERVPYVARLSEYGKVVTASKKDKYRIAVFPKNKKAGVANLMGQLFDRPCTEMNSFLSMTLTPTLHTSRLYDLYADYMPGDMLPDNPYFYAEWRDSASKICLQLDDELHMVAQTLSSYGLDVSDLVPYRIHYESPTTELLTKKLRSIASLSRIKGPIIENNDGTFSLDLTSRYFTESFPFRLAIVKGLADLIDEEVPLTTKILEWYGDLIGKKYLDKGHLLGKDVMECNVPQNYCIKSIDDLVAFYSGK